MDRKKEKRKGKYGENGEKGKKSGKNEKYGKNARPFPQVGGLFLLIYQSAGYFSSEWIVVSAAFAAAFAAASCPFFSADSLNRWKKTGGANWRCRGNYRDLLKERRGYNGLFVKLFPLFDQEVE
ncbi:MAG: hypothetical protein GF308_14165 [Candidatus Heimdallarchaeota archaeon]|nr:hypothetical protein [Candidatus Heimdallarchaeota archaeon]